MFEKLVGGSLSTSIKSDESGGKVQYSKVVELLST